MVSTVRHEGVMHFADIFWAYDRKPYATLVCSGKFFCVEEHFNDDERIVDCMTCLIRIKGLGNG